MLEQVDYEYDFFEQKQKATGVDDENQHFPAAYLKYSRSFNTIVLGTQNGMLGTVSIAAEKQDEEEEDQ